MTINHGPLPKKYRTKERSKFLKNPVTREHYALSEPVLLPPGCLTRKRVMRSATPEEAERIEQSLQKHADRIPDIGSADDYFHFLGANMELRDWLNAMKDSAEKREATAMLATCLHTGWLQFRDNCPEDYAEHKALIARFHRDRYPHQD